MKFMVTFEWKPDTKTRDEGISRFMKTGGLPPTGAKLLGRWTRADFSGGFDLIETDDARTLFEFAMGWSDLMELNVIPVVEDEQLVEVFKRLQ